MSNQAKTVAYIDFDRDGAVEAVVQCGDSGDYILRYDSQNDTVTAYYVSPLSNYAYPANG